MLLVYCDKNMITCTVLKYTIASILIYKSLELFRVMAFVGVDLLFLSLLIKKG